MCQLFGFKSIMHFFLILGVLLVGITSIFYQSTFDVFEKALSLIAILTFICSWVWHIIWKIPLLNNWYPNLTGEWKVTIKWHDLKNSSNSEVHGTATIKCSLYKITMELSTDGSNSKTLCCHPSRTDADSRELLYIYSNTANNIPNSKSQDQHGATILKIKNNNEMSGNYWTDKQTKGIITMKRTTN